MATPGRQFGGPRLEAIRSPGYPKWQDLIKAGKLTLGDLKAAAAKSDINSREYTELHEQLTLSLQERLGEDALTGLRNLRFFEERAGSMVKKINHMDGPRDVTPPDEAMLVVLDMDDFGEINNAFGHPFGDEVLKISAKRLLSEARREGDAAIRLGGDEKALLLTFDNVTPKTDAEIKAYFETLQAQVNDNLFAEVDDGKGGKKKIPITFAMGYSVLRRGKPTTVEAFRKEADDNQLLDKEPKIKAARMAKAKAALA